MYHHQQDQQTIHQFPNVDTKAPGNVLHMILVEIKKTAPALPLKCAQAELSPSWIVHESCLGDKF